MTAKLIKLMMPSAFFFGQYDCYKRWLACMRITFMPMVAMFVATTLHIFLCYLFVHVLDWGIEGLAIATSTKDLSLILMVMIYGYCDPDINKALAPLNKECFQGWSEYLKVSLPSTVMVCSEWWAFEFLTIMAGIMGVAELAS